ncbi:MAG TPA: AAA domain-containing protein, partial [Longimicrobiaceae bacterium]|nr:AAA domain-containing protein [Longimicrobiaceae bacterium]
PAACAWHLSARCSACDFYQHCRAQADAADDLARVPGMTPAARQVLLERGVRSVAALQRAGFRRETYTGCHALETGEGRLRQRAQALRFDKLFDVEQRTHRMAAAEGVRVLLSAEGDPVSGTVFALGLRVEGPEGSAEGDAAVFLSAAGTRRAEGEMLCAFLARLAAVVGEARAAAPEGRGRRERAARALHFYVYEREELELFRSLLRRHLADPAAGPAIAALARALFPAAEAGGLRRGSAAPGTVLLDAVNELFALPVAYALDLGSVSAALQPEESPRVYRPRTDYAWPLSTQVAFERIHDVWSGRRHRTSAGVETPDEVAAELRRTVAAKLAALDSVVRAVRERVAKRAAERLLLEPAEPPSGAGGEPIADPVLETLRVFAELEAAEQSLAVRGLHALPTRDRARRFECISGMERVETRPNGHAVFEFDPECRDVKFRPGEFALVLTNDDGRTLVETNRQPWLRRKLMVELVEYDLTGPRPRVVLASDYGFAKMEAEKLLDLERVCVLDRAEADFNTRRVVSTLRHLAAGHGEAAFVRGLLDGAVPADWPAPLDPAGGIEVLGRAAGTLDRPVLNAEQTEAWRAAFEQAVSVVWGPPGTGKTYLLAWTLIGLAAAARQQGRPLRVLVSAATHRAIANVLASLARQAAAAGVDSPLRLVKLVGRGSEADRELEGVPGVDLLDDHRLPGVLAQAAETGEPVVVGATVWSLWKQMLAMNGAAEDVEAGPGDGVPIRPLFDVVVLDEASQMKVPDALIALSSIRRGGRVVLCGDDRQLAPIVRGRYGDDGETLFGSAFAHFAARFGRLSLWQSRRMSRALVAYPRRTFYPGLYSADPERRIRLAGEVDLSDPLDALLWELFFRPEDAVVLCTYAGYRASARNAFEARLAARLATLARGGLLDPETGAPYAPAAFRAKGLAVISPHRAQNSAILGELLSAGWRHDELPVVDTVERMQGNEREMIVVSYAVADAEYAEAEAEFLLSPNRFNVSITRPRSKLVVLMSEEVLRALPRDERVMTESMAIKGYPGHFASPPSELDLPAPDGTPVRVRVYRR